MSYENKIRNAHLMCDFDIALDHYNIQNGTVKNSPVLYIVISIFLCSYEHSNTGHFP